MANALKYKEQSLTIGDTIVVDYKIKESETKERIQKFEGILLKIKGTSDATRMITIRKISKDGIGVERILPVSSPFIADIRVVRKSDYSRAKLYFVRDLSNKQLRNKLYKSK